MTGLQTFVPEQLPEESTILDLEATTIGSIETPTTDILAPFIVSIQFHERQTVPHTTMETNAFTSSGNSSIPTIVVTTEESSPNLPSSVQATMVSVATTSHSGPNPSMVAATTLFTPSATGPPFSYGMPSSGTSPVLTYSTLQTLGLGARSSSAPLQGHLGPFLSLLMLFLTQEVISLLHPLHLVDCINNPSGNLHTIVYLEPRVRDHLCTVCR